VSSDHRPEPDQGGTALNKLPLSVFEHAIMSRHRSRATLIGREEVEERLISRTWRVEVLVFGFADSPKCVYAWSAGASVISVLHHPPVTSPTAAVRAWIADSALVRD
jgi:hypothetical protein